ncbi:unnamed protein product [Fraxinus pennsylvanica]|uniref:AIPP2-like SPOC-like domain-containing protein n=1 Tax=Fraxinus pennsylvanica TaxID=56036 RepID=A0AAD1Z664_9LAMI|nr:unnamed protein product [Fraxinus pennsylvanica]
MQEICLQCGDKGTTNAFVYCVNCLDCVLHRYCMEVVTFDEYVHWVCDDCEAILQKQSAPQNCDAVTCNKEDRTVSEDIEVLSGEELKKCDTLAFETERNACEGDPTPKSSETCTKVGLAERDKSASGSTCPIVEKDQHGSGKQRDQKRRSRQSCESNSEPGVGEHTSLVHKTSFKNSKKMKNAMFCEANSEEHGRNSIYADPNISNSHEEVPKDRQNVSSVLGCHEPALPVITPIWRGSFNIWNKDNGMLDEFVAHMSSKACQKVFDEANQFQGVLHMEMLPKSHMWPKSFETSQPNDDSIALYFFPSDTRFNQAYTSPAPATAHYSSVPYVPDSSWYPDTAATNHGFNVLHPMGWDAFGLPAEQYAIKPGKHAKITTMRNINWFCSQFITVEGQFRLLVLLTDRVVGYTVLYAYDRWNRDEP